MTVVIITKKLTSLDAARRVFGNRAKHRCVIGVSAMAGIGLQALVAQKCLKASCQNTTVVLMIQFG